MEMNTDREWLLMKAEQEDGCVVSAGSLVAGAVQDRYLALFAINADPIVTIHSDGRVNINPKYSTDEAAQAFWDAVRRMGPKGERPLNCLFCEFSGTRDELIAHSGACKSHPLWKD